MTSDIPEITFSTKFLTCHTVACPNENIPVPMQVASITTQFQCGACGEEITDVTDAD